MLRVTLEELDALLNKAPIAADMNPVSRCYLPNTRFANLDDVVKELDSPRPVDPSRTLIIGPRKDEKFLNVRVVHEPFTSDLNEILFDHFDEISAYMLNQSEIAQKIYSDADADVIILYIVDGLSFHDVKKNPPNNGVLEACLVDCPTVTQVAFPNIIGKPPLARLLFDKGYINRIGFSYWTRKDNKLTDELFSTIPTLHRAENFDKIISILSLDLKRQTFVQIIRQGLDGLCHSQKLEINPSVILNQIYENLDQLIELCDQLKLSAKVYLTSDHGILWREEFEPKLIENCNNCHPRYIESNIIENSGRNFLIGNQKFYCLNYPLTRRMLKIDERGVHGGISFQESIVPFLRMEKK
ncbi:MAG: hypothetical protein HPY61_07690 [Methanotrichaceae archaeon]|nr:hypothetical protein [Methanotrichaceae archaeon]